MKIFLYLTATLALTMGAQAATGEQLTEAMFFVVAPATEDQEGYEAAAAVSHCALSKAQASWSREAYTSLITGLLTHAHSMKAAIKTPDTLLQGGLPKKSESLVRDLERLAPYIIECEEMLNARVEF